MVQDLISSYIGSFAKKGFDMAQDMSLHFELEGEIFDFLLNEVGLSPEQIPHSLGGTWDFTHAISWCRKQALKERERFKLTLQAAKRAKRSLTPDTPKTEEEKLCP